MSFVMATSSSLRAAVRFRPHVAALRLKWEGCPPTFSRCSKAIVTATGSAPQLGSARHAGGESVMCSGGSPVAEERLGIPAQPGISKGEDQHGSTCNEDDVHLLSFARVLPRAISARLLPPGPRMQMKQKRQT